MRMTIAEFIWFGRSWINFGKFNLAFRCNSDNGTVSTESIFLNPCGDSTINDYCISVKAGPCYSSIEFSSEGFLHLGIKVMSGSNEINNRETIIELDFGKDILIRKCLLPVIMDLNKFSELASRKKKIKTFP